MFIKADMWILFACAFISLIGTAWPMVGIFNCCGLLTGFGFAILGITSCWSKQFKDLTRDS